jgi:hypothetical protein
LVVIDISHFTISLPEFDPPHHTMASNVARSGITTNAQVSFAGLSIGGDAGPGDVGGHGVVWRVKFG